MCIRFIFTPMQANPAFSVLNIQLYNSCTISNLMNRSILIEMVVTGKIGPISFGTDRLVDQSVNPHNLDDNGSK